MIQENVEGETMQPGVLDTSVEPGLASRVIIIDDFDPVRVGKEFRDFYAGLPQTDKDSRLYVYTPAHVGTATRMGLFGDFAPSVVFASNKYNGTHLPYRESTLSGFGFSKLCHLYCTTDKSVMFGFANRHMARSKVFNLNSAATILHRPDLTLSADHLDDKEVDKQTIIDTLFAVKRNATRLLKEVPQDWTQTVPIGQSAHNLSYPKRLEEILGGNLKRILLYGSSARGEGNDYDNIGVVQSLPDDFYDKIKDLGFNEEGKEVGFIFVPESVLDRFLHINVSNSIFMEHSKALKGHFDFPVDTPRYCLQKEMYHAGFGSAKLVSSMNLAFREPEILFDKPGLFEYFMKLNRFSLHGLLQQTESEIRTKGELLEILRDDFDYEIPEFKADAEYIQESFLKTNKVSVELARRMHAPEIARELNEQILTIESAKSRKIFTAHYGNNLVYVFAGREPLVVGDSVPVRIMKENEEGHEHRRRELKHRGITHQNDFLVGRRV
ncbi:MAG: hypothetical protein KKB31_03940 [Nanoarchaeota archaeon]|nr:hypothetical protein [Nanoarchaeota archaeon]